MIRKARLQDAEQVSKLMLQDLANPHMIFPRAMIQKFLEHAKLENIKKEYENPDLLAFVYEEKSKILAFIVGYFKENKTVYLDYVSGDSKKIKKALVEYFEKECKKLDIKEIITDTYKFLENKLIYEEAGFSFVRSERKTLGLEVLWYSKKLE